MLAGVAGHVHHLIMHFELILRPERNVALVAAAVVRTQIVRLEEVLLQALVVFIEEILVEVVAEVAGEVESVKVVLELELIEVELFAEVAPWVR